MLDRDTRAAILRLRTEGHGTRTIARALGVSRGAVRRVLRSGHVEVPKLERSTELDEHLLMTLRRIRGDFFRLPLPDEDDDHGQR